MDSAPKVHATEVNYELHTLGWKAFQDLCVTIMTNVLGQTFQQFLPSRDGGRDGAFHGSWSNAQQSGVSGSFTVQCKHSSIPASTLTLGDLSDEIEKARRLASKGLADNYILMTNCGLAGRSEEDIREALLAIPGIQWAAVYGSTWITAQIKENPRLRMLVPRVYGLGDLSTIIDERAYEQARRILDVMGTDLKKFVTTDAHNKAANAILQHGFVILLGEPASGKSMIAAALALGAIDVWHCGTAKLINPWDFVGHWNPHEPRQFFWFDDAFGTTQYQRETALAWNRVFPHLHAAINGGARVLFTSRDYIFRAAIPDLKVTAFPLLKESQVIINVLALDLSEKEQMIYNHLKLGDQPREFKSAVKPFLEGVAKSERFLPEIARRIGTALFTKGLILSRPTIAEFVEKPLDYLTEILSGLDCHNRAAVGLLFMHGGSLSSPVDFSKDDAEAVSLLGSDAAHVREALVALDGSIVKRISGAETRWNYKHPTVGDAYVKLISTNPELVDIYLGGAMPVQLVKEVTCGEVGVKGAIVIPASRYERVLAKLFLLESRWFTYTFLAYRCDKEFLDLYCSASPEAVSQALRFGSYMSAVPQVSFIARLHELDLLSEEYRAVFVARVGELAVETPDADFLTNNRIKTVLSEEEIAAILEKVKDEVIPRLDEVIDDWLSNFDRSHDPDSYFEPLKDALRSFQQALPEDDAAYIACGDAIEGIDTLVADLFSSRADDDDDERLHDERGPSGDTLGRSIFDDVDQ